MIYQTIHSNAPEMARQLWHNGIRYLGLNGYTLLVSATASEMADIHTLFTADWFLLPEQDIARLWSPVFDHAYYNGLLFGYFGTIVEADRDTGELTFENNSGLTVKSDKWFWGQGSRNWYVGLADNPLVVARETD